MLEVMDAEGEDDRRKELRTLEKEKSRKREEDIVIRWRILKGSEVLYLGAKVQETSGY